MQDSSDFLDDFDTSGDWGFSSVASKPTETQSKETQEVVKQTADGVGKAVSSEIVGRLEGKLDRLMRLVGDTTDTVNAKNETELEIAKNLAEFEIMTSLTKQNDLKTIKRNSSVKGIHQHLILSTGKSAEDYKRLNEIMKECSFFEFICIDIANGYSDHFSKFVSSVREKYPTKTIIAGNVVTADMTQELVMNGADIVKVGIGPGSVCTTRIQTGVGYPQLSAVIECADAAHGLGAHIIADGGCTCPGDVAKAFGGGADFVMLGGMFAGHDEGKGKIVKKNGSKYIEFYGSSSNTAVKKHYGGLSAYRSSVLLYTSDAAD